MTRTSRKKAIFLIIISIFLLYIPSALGANECPCQDPCSCDDTHQIPANCNCPFGWNETDINSACLCPFGWNESDTSPRCACPFGWNETDINSACLCPFGWNESDSSVCCSCPFGATCGSRGSIFHGELNADFSANVTSGVAPLTVKFSQSSTGQPTAWEWDFGDGKGSSASNPVHTYTAPGTYTVTLTISRVYSPGPNTQMVEQRSVTKSGYIQVTGYGSMQSSDQASADQKSYGNIAHQKWMSREHGVQIDTAKPLPLPTKSNQWATISPGSGIPIAVNPEENPAGPKNGPGYLNEFLTINKISPKTASFPIFK